MPDGDITLNFGFASVEDIAARLGHALSEAESAAAQLLLDGATSMIAAAVDKDDDWADALDPVPRVLRFVCIEVVCRAMANPQGMASLAEQLGAYASTARYRDLAAGGGLQLTQTEELLARRTVYGTTSGSSRPVGTVDEVYDVLYGS